VFIRTCVDQLQIDPHIVANSLNRTFEYGVDAELCGDFTKVSILVPVAHHGGARGDLQSLDVGKLGQQVVMDAVGKQLVFRIIAAAGERQYCNRAPGTGNRRCVFTDAGNVERD
jgi:hypothetical protein